MNQNQPNTTQQTSTIAVTAPLNTPPAGSAQPTTATAQYASFLQRLGAVILDCILVGIVCSIFGQFLGQGSALSTLVQIAISVTYFVVLYVQLDGMSVGKKVLGIKVAKLDGTKMDYATAIIRVLGTCVSGFALWIGYFWMLFDDKKQTWHDKLAKTVVVKV